jgi:hypothetical protein
MCRMRRSQLAEAYRSVVSLSRIAQQAPARPGAHRHASTSAAGSTDSQLPTPHSRSRRPRCVRGACLLPSPLEGEGEPASEARCPPLPNPDLRLAIVMHLEGEKPGAIAAPAAVAESSYEFHGLWDQSLT